MDAQFQVGTKTQGTPLISIITVCRNSARTIQDSFDSVLCQEYPNIDYIVVDGVSTDGTLDVIKQNEEKFRSKGIRFRWISEPDKGIYDAINKGIHMAKGDIIGILNSDDYYEPNACQIMANASVDNPGIGIFYGFLRVLLGADELLIYRYRYERYLLDLKSGIYSASQHPTCFVRRSVYDQVGFFDQQFPVAADHDFLIRAMQADVKFFPLDAVISNFRSGGVSDLMNDYERHKQRYGVWHKNGLLSDAEYRQKQNQLRYKKYRQLKQRIAGWLFRL